jgi:hypothetical protein
MRTTTNIDDDALAIANAYANARALKLGQAVSELIRLSSAEKLRLKEQDGVWVFDLPVNSPAVMAKQVRKLLE